MKSKNHKNFYKNILASLLVFLLASNILPVIPTNSLEDPYGISTCQGSKPEEEEIPFPYEEPNINN